jgi:hypothetical protein
MTAATKPAPVTDARKELVEVHGDLVDLASAMRGVASLAHDTRTSLDASPKEREAHSGVVGGLQVMAKALQDAVERLDMAIREVR